MLGIDVKVNDKEYYYDTMTNMLIRIPKDGKNDTEFVDYMKNEYNLFSEKRFNKFEFPKIKKEEYKSINHIIINMTNNCNFRCTYCKYGGSYDNVPMHSDASIAKETLYKIIQFIKDLKKNLDEDFIIGFYGGEPLLEFEKIKWFVNLLKLELPKIKFRFSMTTNGSLISKEEVVDFIIENDFFVNISLDGPKPVHDSYRIFYKGVPSFDSVFKNIQLLKRRNKAYFLRKIGYSCVIAPPYSIKKVLNFLASDEVFTNGPLFFSLVDEEGTDFYKKHSNKEIEKVFAKEIEELRECYLQKLKANLTDERFFKVLDAFFGREIFNLHERAINKEIFETCFPIGNCVPGIQKLFIGSEGKYYICEKINYWLDLGNVENGFDFEKIKEIENQFVKIITDNGCLTCPYVRICGLCMAKIADSKGFSKERLKNHCVSTKNRGTKKLEFYLKCLGVNKEYFTVKKETK